jgi:hypothetical protein
MKATSKEIKLMFDLEEIENFATKKISYPLLIKGKDYDYERGRIFYKKSAIKKISKYLDKTPRKVDKKELTPNPKVKQSFEKFITTDSQKELLEWAKKYKQQERDKVKLKLLKGLLVIPKVQRLNFHN